MGKEKEIYKKLLEFNSISKVANHNKEVYVYGNHKKEDIEVLILKFKTQDDATEVKQIIQNKLEELNILLAKNIEA